MEPEEPRQNRTVVKAAAFLAAYQTCCSVTKAARAAGIDPRRHYAWLDKYPKYKAEFEKAKPIAAQWLKDKAIEGATDGWEEPIFYQGVQCGTVTRFDLGMRQFLLRGILAEEFGAKVDHNVHGAVEIIQRLVAARNRFAKAAPPA